MTDIPTPTLVSNITLSPTDRSPYHPSLPSLNETTPTATSIPEISGPDSALLHPFNVQQSNSNNEPPLVSDTSESQLEPPDHDFAFYEWDFKEDTAPGQSTEIPKPLTTTNANDVLTEDKNTLCSIGDEIPVISASIEELMRPSIYKSQLSRELGPALAAALHSDMFGGGITIGPFAASGQTQSTGTTELLPPVGGIHQERISQESPQQDRRIRHRRASRHHTIDILPQYENVGTRQRDRRASYHGVHIEPHDGQQEEMESPSSACDAAFSDGDIASRDMILSTQTPLRTRSNRRSRTVDHNFGRELSSHVTMSDRRQRNVEISGSFRKVLTRLSSAAKKKKRIDKSNKNDF